MTEWNEGIAKIVLPTPFPVGDVNVYVVKGERLTLVDVGPKTDEAWEALTLQLKDLDLTPEDIEQVVLTHHHPDHAGLLDYFPASLDVYGHRWNERWISQADLFLQEHDDFFQKMFVEFGLPDEFFPYIARMKKTLRFSCNRSLTGMLGEGDHPIGMSEWTVIETPGHAQSQIGLLRKRDGVYIAGDHLLANISPNPLLEPPLPGETERPKPQLQYNASLRKLLEVPLLFVYTGHGGEITDPHRLIERRLVRQHERAMQVKQLLVEKPLTVYETCVRLFPTIYAKELSLTMSETVAQLDYLSSLGEITIQKDDKAFRYSV
ncbi:MBL fold metallo-hydrolase [Cytobacillus spongiae]|uniref:MBL fold metallo-hydrolase n=1 Tax=Cytobacillus spongiae TaxID=2901381 RepID=UPI001F2B1FE8|nr:MBL fold metallo-hydrolase [Cytobacillus spongiae]UII54740.1 MBL fold metallo-hydrolase [Cytobacillus spongiae]